MESYEKWFCAAIYVAFITFGVLAVLYAHKTTARPEEYRCARISNLECESYHARKCWVAVDILGPIWTCGPWELKKIERMEVR